MEERQKCVYLLALRLRMYECVQSVPDFNNHETNQLNN